MTSKNKKNWEKRFDYFWVDGLRGRTICFKTTKQFIAKELKAQREEFIKMVEKELRKELIELCCSEYTGLESYSFSDCGKCIICRVKDGKDILTKLTKE